MEKNNETNVEDSDMSKENRDFADGDDISALAKEVDQNNSNKDGGYGWVIVLAFFFIEVLVDGCRFSYGIYFVEFVSEFETGKGETAMIGSLMIGVYNLAGPLFAFIVNKFGFRISAFIGGLIATIGYAASFFAPSVYFLYFSYGVCTGFGFGLVFLSGTVAVGRYFFRKRAMAMGIGLCGAGVGTFVFVPLVRYLLDTYAWRGSMLIMSGMALNCCLCAMLLVPRKLDDIFDADRVDLELVAVQDVGNDNGSILSDHTARNGSICTVEINGKDSISTFLKNKMLPGRSVKGSPLPTRTFAELRMEQLNAYKHTSHGSYRSVNPGLNNQGSHRSLGQGSFRSINMPILSQSILGSNASFEYIFEKRTRSRTSSLNVSHPLTQQHSIFLNHNEKAIENVTKDNDKFTYPFIEAMFPKVLMKNLNFMIMMAVCLVAGTGSFVPFSMLPDFALSVGSTPAQSAWPLSVIGIGGVCFLVIGVTTTIAAFMTSFVPLVIYAAFYGIFFGAVYTVQPIVFFEYFGEEYIAELLGSCMLWYGVASFIGAPMAGLIFDATGSYQSSFLATGVIFLVAGVINFFVLCTGSCQRVDKNESFDDSTEKD
ncbi:monocarboxylate transporter 12-like isoform X2 [Mya arenaria]|uniref:monocarboxylate transporter 12-like isoform X2 n=1 Tax=Mya arenaria TaxID=6604 RepID=UPI0022E94A3E|nr:monocarboxylate transporter 12-like isoform X2 [Mya arenaria]